jgi:hypothetical protein
MNWNTILKGNESRRIRNPKTGDLSRSEFVTGFRCFLIKTPNEAIIKHTHPEFEITNTN